jgi:AcrR family transcriptional regulator
MDNHEVVEKLRRAVLEIASHDPGEELTVARISSAAGITRDDYYRHASSPMQLLAEALSDELLTRYDELEEQYPDLIARALRPRVALTHIAKWAVVYRGPMRSELMQALQKTLAPSFRMINEEDLRAHPELIPAGMPPDDLSIEFVSAYISGGGMAAIEVWVSEPEPDVERGLQMLMAVSPLTKVDEEVVQQYLSQNT